MTIRSTELPVDPIRERGQLRRSTLFACVSVAGAVVASLWLFGSRYDAVRADNLDELEPSLQQLIGEKIAAVEDAPDSARAHGILGLAYKTNGMHAEAARSLQNAERLEPDNLAWAYHRAGSLCELGEVTAGHALFAELAGHVDAFAAIHNRHGVSLLEQGDAEAAEQAFRRVVELADNHLAGHVGLAETYIQRRRFEAAKAAAERALALDSGSKIAHFLLGQAYRGLGDRDAARRELALGQNADRPPMPDPLSGEIAKLSVGQTAQVQAAFQAFQAGNMDESQRILEKALETWPGDITLLSNLGNVLLMRNRHAKAIEVLQQALAQDDTVFKTHYNLARCYLATDKTNKALEHAGRAAELGRGVGSTHAVHAQVLEKLNRQQDALSALRTAMEVDPSEHEWPHRAAKLCLKMRRDDEAFTYVQKTAQLAPSSVDAQLNVAIVGIQIGRFAEARQALTAAQRIRPGHPQIAQLQGELRKRGQ